jgi:WD40 repeat protein
MGNSKKKLFFLPALFLTMLACNLSWNGNLVNATQISVDLVATTVTVTQISQDKGITEEPEAGVSEQGPSVLPHTLYFLSDMEGTSQVWRLEKDSITQVRLTSEIDEVVVFDVSPMDGSVAYVVGNRLYLVDSNGENKRLLVDGGPVSQEMDFIYFQRVGTLRWSPDGQWLAFSQGGVKLYDLKTGTIISVIENEVEMQENELLFPRALYAPEQWAQDGKRLMVSIGWHEGGTLGVLDITTGSVVQLGQGIVCCDATWTNDESSILVASPVLGMISSGLWRYDAVSGEQATLIPSSADDGTLNFAGWPLQLASGELLYFYNNMPNFQETVPLVLVRSGPDGVTDRVQLRSDVFEIHEALWAPDGSMVVIVQPNLGEQTWPRFGPLVLVNLDGSPVRPLVVRTRGLRWGP